MEQTLSRTSTSCSLSMSVAHMYTKPRRTLRCSSEFPCKRTSSAQLWRSSGTAVAQPLRSRGAAVAQPWRSSSAAVADLAVPRGDVRLAHEEEVAELRVAGVDAPQQLVVQAYHFGPALPGGHICTC